MKNVKKLIFGLGAALSCCVLMGCSGGGNADEDPAYTITYRQLVSGNKNIALHTTNRMLIRIEEREAASNYLNVRLFFGDSSVGHPAKMSIISHEIQQTEGSQENPNDVPLAALAFSVNITGQNSALVTSSDPEAANFFGAVTNANTAVRSAAPMMLNFATKKFSWTVTMANDEDNADTEDERVVTQEIIGTFYLTE